MHKVFEQIIGTVRQQPNFMKFWAADSISLFGAQISLLALPLTATLLLHASPSQMGYLVAIETLPFALFSLHAGAMIDRHRNLPLIRCAALSRGCLLLAVPFAAHWDLLRIEILFAVAFLVSSLSIVSDVAYQTLVAKLVSNDKLIDANAKLGLSESSAAIAGPGLTGVLVQWLGAPFALAMEAMIFLLSGSLLAFIKLDEPVPVQNLTPRSLGREIQDGFQAVWRSSILRWTAILMAAWQFLNHMFLAIFVLFAVREAGLAATTLGMVFSTSGAGFLIGSLFVRQLSDAIGLGPTLLVGMSATTLGWIVVCFTQGTEVHVIASLCFAFICEGFGTGLFFLTYISLRQGITPEVLLGRVISTMRFLTISATPLGAMVGGALGEAFGLRATIVLVAIGGIAISVLAILYSPLKRLKQIPRLMTVSSTLTATASPAKEGDSSISIITSTPAFRNPQ